MIGFPSSMFARTSAPPPPPPSYGAELVNNGTFDSGTGGGTNLGSGSLSSVAGKLRISSVGADNGAKQAIFALEAGATYRLMATMQPSESNRARGALYNNNGWTYYYFETVGGSVDFEFVASGAAIEIGFEAASSTAWASNGQYAEFDDVSVRKRL